MGIGLTGTVDATLGYLTGHAYALYYMADDYSYMTLINPWNSGDKINIDLTEYNENLINEQRNIAISVNIYGWLPEDASLIYISNSQNYGSYYAESSAQYVTNIAAIQEQTANWLASGGEFFGTTTDTANTDAANLSAVIAEYIPDQQNQLTYC